MKMKLEEQAKNEYAHANARLLAEQEKLELLQKRLEDAKEKLKMILKEELSVVEIRRREDAVEVIKMYVMQQLLTVKRCEKEVEVARDKLTEAMKERKTFEKLREKAFEAFLIEEQKAEQKEVDELVSYKYGAKTKNA
nr:flagellar export protein FliJ [Eubacterium sp.]